jgi:hypothetical protein
LLAYLHTGAGKKTLSLRTLLIVRSKAARNVDILGKPSLIPGPLRLWRSNAKFAVIGQQLEANVDAFPADVTRPALKEPLNFTLAKPTERASSVFGALTRCLVGQSRNRQSK